METSSSAAMEQINDTYPETNEDVPDSHIIKQTLMIWRILPPFFIILGTFGNILIIAVLNKTVSNKHATGIFLRALAFSDILGLYVGLCAQWIAHLADSKMLEKGTFLCKVLSWITYSVLDFSSWILVAVTIERVIASCFHLRAKSLCTKNFAFGYIVASGTILLAINEHMLKGFEYVEEDNDFFCVETPESYKHFFKHVWPWIDMFIYSLLPFIVIFVGNLTIFLRVKRSRKRSMKTRNVSLDSSRKSSSLPRPIHIFSHLTVTLFLINTAFLMSTCPICIFLLVVFNLPSEYLEDSSNKASLELAWAIVYIFMYINNAVNVFLYCLSGTRFRSGVKNLYRSFKINPPSGSSSLSRGRSFAEYSTSIRGKQSSSSYTQATPDTHDTQNQASVVDNEIPLGETDVFLKNNLTSACSNLDNKDNTSFEDVSMPQNDTYL